MIVIHPLFFNLIIWQLSVPPFWSIIFLCFIFADSTVFAFSLKYNSTIQFLFKIKLAGVITEYMPTSVKFSHCHNIYFIWLAENTRKILVKNANISLSKIFLISPCHAKKDAEFRLWLLLLSIFRTVCFIRGMLVHTTFFSSLWGFSTGVEMTERELDQFLWRDILPYPATVFLYPR